MDNDSKTIAGPGGDNEALYGTLRQSLTDFTLMRLQFTFAATTGVFLGADEKKGDRWRCGFKDSLMRLNCFYNGKTEALKEKSASWKSCVNCSITGECAYYYYCAGDKPRPYVFHPGLDSKRSYKPGEHFYLDITLAGQAIKQVNRFIHAIHRLGTDGIGSGRHSGDETGRFTITDIVAETFTIEDFFAGMCTAEKGRIEFLTPMKLKDQTNGLYYNGSDISFQLLFKFLLNRIINLNNIYCNEALKKPADFNNIVSASSASTGGVRTMLDEVKRQCILRATETKTQSHAG